MYRARHQWLSTGREWLVGNFKVQVYLGQGHIGFFNNSWLGGKAVSGAGNAKFALLNVESTRNRYKTRQCVVP
jgi:hypothetical protein